MVKYLIFSDPCTACSLALTSDIVFLSLLEKSILAFVRFQPKGNDAETKLTTKQ